MDFSKRKYQGLHDASTKWPKLLYTFDTGVAAGYGILPPVFSTDWRHKAGYGPLWHRITADLCGRRGWDWSGNGKTCPCRPGAYHERPACARGASPGPR